MTKKILLSTIAASMLTTSAFATNGDHLIGLGAKARGMGGVGVALSHGAESGLANPALIASVKNKEVSFGGTIFMPDVKSNMGAGSGTSAADMSVIPEVSIASKVNENLFIGIGMWGTAGMGVDYRDSAKHYNMVTNLQLMQFGVPVAYKTGAVSVGITPLLQYGALDIKHYQYNPSTGAYVSGGSEKGIAQDLAFGYNLGASYELNKELVLGVSYKAPIEMEYKGQISQAMADFTSMAASNFSDKLEQPAEMGLGVSYAMGANTFAFDYKTIAWSSAAGYKDFKWDDQTVMAIGYEYNGGTWQARAGYNQASSPISNLAASGQTVTSGADTNYLTNTFNVLGFPAIVESHMTVGGTMEIGQGTTLDLAYVIVPESTFTSTGTSGQAISVTHSQTSLSFQVNMTF